MEDEKILAVPYDPLYYFLTGRDSASYYLAFFDFIHITREEEFDLILGLEREKIQYVIMSNRAFSLEPHLGFLGRKYCPMLAQYIFQNFYIVKEFGVWEKPPFFVENHGVKIFKRRPIKNTLQNIPKQN